MDIYLRIRQGDTLPIFYATITDGNDNPIDLTGATVTFVMRPLYGTTAVVDASATAVNAGSGQISYDWSTDDTATPGYYAAELHVTEEDGSTYTYPNTGYLTIKVEGSLAS